MFKKTTMSLALTAAMIGGVAMTQQSFAAIQTSMSDYTGDILLYPYYTVDNGFKTLIHIVNTSDTDTTIAKVRLRDYKDSKDVLDFTIILSPNDVFAGTITSDGNGAIVLNKANDTTCTSPNITSFVPHSTRATGSSGHIEVITLATLNKNDVAVKDVNGDLAYPVLNEIVTKSKHDSSGNNTSADCGVVDAYFAKSGIKALQEDLVGYTKATIEKDNKTGINPNLMGHYTILDLDKGIQGGGRPSTLAGALNGYTDDEGTFHGLHSPCDMTGSPSTNNTIICGQYTEHYEFPNLIHVEGVDVFAGATTDNVAAFNRTFSGPFGSPGFTSYGIRNEWTKNSTATSTVNSEWIVTLPTKYVYNDSYPASTYIGMKTSRDVFAPTGGDNPDEDMWDETTAALFEPAGINETTNRLFDKEGCSNYNSFKFDREEQTSSSGTSTSGGQADGTVGYCNEVATLTFGDYNGVTHDNTAPIVFRISTETLNQKFGWGGFGLTDTAGNSISLPIIGYSMWNRDFGHPGSNFGHIMDHVKSVKPADTKNQ